MVPALICFLLFLSAGFISSYQDDGDNQTTSNKSNVDSPEKICSYWDILQNLSSGSMAQEKAKYTMTRPVTNSKTKTIVRIEMAIFSILDLKEEDQSFIAYVWFLMEWNNEYIHWNLEDFCGIEYVQVPREALWMPDITIEEMIEKDKAPISPFLYVAHNGTVGYRDDKVVKTTCKMHIYYFPFDTQSCNISFKSVSYADYQLTLDPITKNEFNTNLSMNTIQMKYEWEFLNISVRRKEDKIFNYDQDIIVYTVTMRRKSTLYVVNFLLPVLFFWCLDVASILMSNGGGEKISFKVTVLLAVTVMQLILIEILPFTTSKIPLIVIYCIGIFSIMLLSLLETIWVNYLMEKDSHDDGQIESDNKPIKASSIEMMDQTTSMYQRGGSSQLTGLLEKISIELREIKTTLHGKKTKQKGGYWTRVAKKIDKIFSTVYILGVLLFLIIIFSEWQSQLKRH
ncbi:PREDICTED: 5-hydroxytryptamine receptor 3A-like [Cyprinodon variegatus]|uniref:5-hydroxytryptamine receptor 3A-like n=1 Tax=Cyprinodon variegatus TaxID=28743 RepID=UPI0007429414|nr:PREDICTED: 5-hydroxytryptamine receptor 3A-like [Cyprinodon variegatus]